MPYSTETARIARYRTPYLNISQLLLVRYEQGVSRQILSEAFGIPKEYLSGYLAKARKNRKIISQLPKLTKLEKFLLPFYNQQVGIWRFGFTHTSLSYLAMREGLISNSSAAKLVQSQSVRRVFKMFYDLSREGKLDELMKEN